LSAYFSIMRSMLSIMFTFLHQTKVSVSMSYMRVRLKRINARFLLNKLVV